MRYDDNLISCDVLLFWVTISLFVAISSAVTWLAVT